MIGKATYLNHVLDEKTPSYGNFEPVKLGRPRQICCGDTSNNSKIEFSFHTNTHIDASSHFYQEGKSLDKISASFWIDKSTYLLNLEDIKQDQIIDVIDIEAHLKHFQKNIDFLILKTSFEKFRNEDHSSSKYIFNGPGLSPRLGDFLRNQTEIQIIGFDFISLTSFSNRELGREAHRSFLNPKKPILIVEDMKLSHVNQVKKVSMFPFLYKDADGSPITIVAKEYIE